jgi:hypothetical protein
MDIQYFPSMLVSDLKTNSVIRFNKRSGQYWNAFVKAGAGGLDTPWGIAFGPTGHFFVASNANARVIMYHGSTGGYVKKFCDVASPRGLTFHGGDLYVCSSHMGAVYRFNGVTGASRGILAKSHLLQHAWSIVFDPVSNASLVASQQTHKIVRIGAPTEPKNAKNGFLASAGTVFSNVPVHHITGVEILGDHVYAVSPYTGRGIMQFERETGLFRHRFDEEAFLEHAFDIKASNGTLYVCGDGGIRNYSASRIVSRLSPESRLHAEYAGLKCAFLLINTRQGF